MSVSLLPAILVQKNSWEEISLTPSPFFAVNKNLEETETSWMPHCPHQTVLTLSREVGQQSSVEKNGRDVTETFICHNRTQGMTKPFPHPLNDQQAQLQLHRWKRWHSHKKQISQSINKLPLNLMFCLSHILLMDLRWQSTYLARIFLQHHEYQGRGSIYAEKHLLLVRFSPVRRPSIKSLERVLHRASLVYRFVYPSL